MDSFKVETLDDGKVKIWYGLRYTVVSQQEAQDAATNPAAAARLTDRLTRA